MSLHVQCGPNVVPVATRIRVYSVFSFERLHNCMSTRTYTRCYPHAQPLMHARFARQQHGWRNVMICQQHHSHIPTTSQRGEIEVKKERRKRETGNERKKNAHFLHFGILELWGCASGIVSQMTPFCKKLLPFNRKITEKDGVAFTRSRHFACQYA